MQFELNNQLGVLVLEHSPCLIALLDRDLKIVYANRAFTSMFGQRVGDPCFQVYKQLTEPCPDCPAQAGFLDGGVHRSKQQGITGSDKWIEYQVQAIPVTSEGGVDHILQIGQDVTRLHHLEDGLKQAERLATIGMTTAGLAHTIKNILSGLQGGQYAMETGFEKHNEERLKAGWQMVREYLDQISGLVKNLLEYSKPKPAVHALTAPSELVERVVALFQKKASFASIALEQRVEPQLEPIMLDADAINACLDNLVSNSIDACTWDPDFDKKHTITIAAASSEHGVVFTVSDNGAGITQENQRKILSAFFTTKGIRGTGLGLLLTQQTVKDHGGTIRFTSTYGEGTTFEIEIPANHAARSTQ